VLAEGATAELARCELIAESGAKGAAGTPGDPTAHGYTGTSGGAAHLVTQVKAAVQALRRNVAWFALVASPVLEHREEAEARAVAVASPARAVASAKQGQGQCHDRDANQGMPIELSIHSGSALC